MPISKNNKRVALTISKAEWEVFEKVRIAKGLSSVGRYLLIGGREKYRLDSSDKKTDALAAPLV